MAEFPCIECTEECENDVLECHNCKNWVHRNCVKMTPSAFRVWAVNSRTFLCKKCCFSGDIFDAEAALERLLVAQAGGKVIDLINAACSEQGLLHLYKVELPQPSQQSDDIQINDVDRTSKKIIEVYQPVMLEQYAPLSVLGDGNCLYRAVSRSLCNNENYHVLLRLKTAIEIITNRKYYDTGRRSYVDMIDDNRIIVTEYKKLVEDTLKLGSYSEMIQIYAISAVLNVPIRSYYPPQLKPELASDAFTRNVVGRNIKSSRSSDIVIMWTQMCYPKNIRHFIPNHFVTLKDIRNEPVETVLVCDDEKKKAKDGILNSSNLSLGGVSDLDWTDDCIDPDSHDISVIEQTGRTDDNLKQRNDNPKEPDSHNISDIEQKEQTCDSLKQGNDTLNGSFDQRNLDNLGDSLDFGDQNDSNATQNSLGSELHDDCDECGTLNGTFMEVNALVTLLQKSEHCLEKIPLGLKENKYFIVKNDNNADRRKNGQRSRFSDDCGVWQGKSGGTPTTYFLILPSGELKAIVKRVNEGFCFKQKKKGQNFYVPLNPQPLDSEVIELHRYYSKLKKDITYQKRVSWLGLGGDVEIAVVEYIRTFPGLCPHGNSKHKDEYMRTPDTVMDEMKELLKTKKPRQVHDKLSAKYDVLSGPDTLKQVQDVKRHEMRKDRQKTGLTSNRHNIADHLIEIENRVSRNDPFIRSVIRQNGKAPCIILYHDEQIHDLKILCCTGQTVLGVDKTFNLCDMHVTVTCYKQLSVVKEGTAEHPLFIGPIFIHDNSDFDTYCNFFLNLKIKMNDVDTTNLVIGSDDERALVNAIKAAFPQSKHILCTRHLRQNATQKLTDDAVDKYDKATILDKIFGDDGLLHVQMYK